MNSGPLLAVGSTGIDVRRLQIILVMIKLLDYRQLDGDFGLTTQAAVKSFQQANNLVADGIVGPVTWHALPADPNTARLKRGATGIAVVILQKGLIAFGGAGAATDPGPIDGDFGPKTEAAVRAYQAQHGLTADGIVSDPTWWVPAGGAGATLASLAGLMTA